MMLYLTVIVIAGCGLTGGIILVLNFNMWDLPTRDYYICFFVYTSEIENLKTEIEKLGEK